MNIDKEHGLSWLSPIGPLTVYESKEKLTALVFGNAETGAGDVSPLLHEAQRQVSAYFDYRLYDFDLPLDISCGTAFQQKVWRALTEIPYGHTACYADIAEAVGNPRAVRAIGMANHCNPLPIILPCHRVIGKNGALTGYAGGLAVKRFLLELEERNLPTG